MADEELLKNIDRPSSSQPAPAPPESASPSSNRRREQVAAACERCRKKKVKCSGQRPCDSCVKVGLPCRWHTEEGETHTQAIKRKHDETTSELEAHVELLELIRTQDASSVAEIIRRIQFGHDAQTVVKAMRISDAGLSIIQDFNQTAVQAYLINLAHSTGSLREVTMVATKHMNPLSRISLPSAEEFLFFRNNIVHLSQFEALVQRAQRPNDGLHALLAADAASTLGQGSPSTQNDLRQLLTGSGDRAQAEEEKEAPIQVPAAPWTRLTTDDEAVSHLVSIFFAWVNPTWRFVEQDLFLMGMRSRNLRSEFCSPLLVNSICAIASMQSEHDVAFPPNEGQDRIKRGEHFRKEALEMMNAEDNRPKLTNVQACCILALESNYRANDRKGLSFLPIAAQLDDQLPRDIDDTRCAALGITRQDWRRARVSGHWSAKCAYIIMHVAFMAAGTHEWRTAELPKIQEVFEDTVEFWRGYPLARESTPYRPTLYLLERCRLAEIFREIHELLLTNKSREADMRVFAANVRKLSAKMEVWFSRLPIELQYDWPISIAVWELHASYQTVQIILLLAAKNHYMEEAEKFAHASSSPETARANEVASNSRLQLAKEMLAHATPFAHTAATMLRDFREHYGLKITPAWLLQLEAVASNVLIVDPALTESAATIGTQPAIEGTPAAVFSSSQPRTPSTSLASTAAIPAHRATTTSFTAINHSNPNNASPTRPHQISDSHTAFEEIFRCLLGTGVQVMIARVIARMTYHEAQQRKIVLSRPNRELLQIMSATAWRPTDLQLVNSAFPNFATVRGCGDQERLSALLEKWETFEL